MKKIIFFLILLAVAFPASAQVVDNYLDYQKQRRTIDTTAVERRVVKVDRAPRYAEKRLMRQTGRAERHFIPGKQDNIFVSGGISGILEDLKAQRFKIEYSHQIDGRLYWGATFTLHVDESLNNKYIGRSWDRPVGDTWMNLSRPDIYKFSGMIFYRIPVVKDRLYFRVGGGVGVGIRQNHTTFYTAVASQGNPKSTYAQQTGAKTNTQVIPYVDLEAAWILRLGRDIEMKFAPVPFVMPSEMSFSLLPVRNREPYSRGGLSWLFSPFFGAYLTIGGRF